MSLNLSELQQKANQVLFNSDEAIRKWVEFISAPAGNVSFQYYDRNGNLQQVSFDNRNKLVQNFISNVNSAMSKTFYVDAVNGNDGNDGSQNAPFKTLKKAMDSVPIGGKGNIYIENDYTLDDNVDTSNKNIAIYSDYNLIIDSAINSSNYNYFPYSISGGNNTLFIAVNKLIIAPSYDDTKTNDGVSDKAIRAWTGYCGNYAPGYFNLIIDTRCKNDIFVELYGLTMFGVQAGWGGGQVTNINLSLKRYNYTGNSIFKIYNNNARIMRGYNMSFTINTSDYIKLHDVNDNELNWADYISTIVRDTNGVPRNIASNIVL